ncbi:hypothetical protein MNEG_1290 [Monoraphidium neglectum]|uniref:Uncharacterized protein n=1 Tax=Monoraphidium neglectum TaxID=145388 RepID=A0A0D2N2Q4_9CHLO|nr:hypothetical protein MNEG_1290 [Monoraphidium neglectum]KIZ06657.1 hypothetical protein MNEG_1290 [Monoraphidium neglectum]|eukprot:XP_013905676.1 hypothetical protein MNEG_1290 [Monoraphidium neglectum]
MARTGTAVARIVLALLLAHGAAAAVIQQDNSAVCVSVMPACEAKCKGQQYFFICAAGNGPMGTPYIICRCAQPAPAVGGPQQIARLALSNWPGAKACNQKTWANDCTTQLTAAVNGTAVTLTPAVGSAFNENCAPASGIVIGPKGAQAAVVFPQYPIGLTSTGADGSVTIDFSQTAADDPNQNDWSQCILTYRVVQGTFLDPRLAIAQQRQQQALVQQQAGAQQGQAAKAASGAAGAGMAARAQVAAAAGVAAAYFAVFC